MLHSMRSEYKPRSVLIILLGQTNHGRPKINLYSFHSQADCANEILPDSNTARFPLLI